MSGRILRSAAVAVLTLGALTGGISSASAADSGTLTPQEESSIRQWLVDNGVKNTTAKILVGKWDRGIVWDSLNGGAPTSTKTTETSTETVTRAVYADGSIRVSSIEKPQASASSGDFSVQSVTGCSVKGGSGYSVNKYCLVKDKFGPVTMSFRADYQIVSSGYDSIQAVSEPVTTLAGGTKTSERLSVTKSKEDTYGPARARHVVEYNLTGNVGSSASAHSLLVGGNSGRSDGGEL